MSPKTFIICLTGASFALTATTAAAASGKSVTRNQPATADAQIYCLKVAPMTGSRLGSTECRTKKEWARDGIEVEKIAKKPA